MKVKCKDILFFFFKYSKRKTKSHCLITKHNKVMELSAVPVSLAFMVCEECGDPTTVSVQLFI